MYGGSPFGIVPYGIPPGESTPGPSVVYAYPIADISNAGWLPYPPAALVPETVRNLLTYTQSFDLVWTVFVTSVTADAATDPDGNMTADKLVEAVTTSIHALSQSNPATVAALHTFSVYAKPVERSWIELQINNAVASKLGSCYFNLATGTVGTPTDPGGVSFTQAIAVESNGYYRCSVSMVCAIGATSVSLLMATADSTHVYAGDGSSGLLLSSVQFEPSALTAYQPIIATTPPLVLTGSDALFDKVDEPTTPDDADYIYSLAPGDVAELKFGPVDDPTSSDDHIVRIEAWSPTGARDLQVDVYCGATLITTRTLSLTTTSALYEIELTGAEADAITNYSNVRVRPTSL